MYQLIDMRTGEVLAEYYEARTAMIRCNALVFVYGQHYAVKPTFTPNELEPAPYPKRLHEVLIDIMVGGKE
jgi:hypothetical protein